jgi:hypothetical protein
VRAAARVLQAGGNHSAMAVAGSSTRYSPRTISPRWQRASVATWTARRPRGISIRA